MANGTCGIPDCGRSGTIVRGWCGRHYQRWLKYGDPLVTRVILDDEARFWSKVDKRGPDECWPWTAPTDKDGYGSFNVDNGHVGAHRWSYGHFVKPIPDGMTIDHLCHTRERLTCLDGTRCPHRKCVNPAHLEPVTTRENVQRGFRLTVTHCANGHEWTPENTYITSRGQRWCRGCDRDRSDPSAPGGWKKKPTGSRR